MTPTPGKPSETDGSPDMAPVEDRDRLVEKVVRQLTRDIMAGIYGPGDRIREPEVSERLGISRAPVREALRNLEHEGMVEVMPWRGARVINPSPDEIADLFDLLAAVEGVVARLATRHASDEDLARYAKKVLEAAEVAREHKQKDFFEVIHVAYQAAEVLAASCGSAMAANMVRRIGKPAYWLHRFLMPAPQRWIQQSLARQAALRDALLARDEDRSERAARALVGHTRRLVVLRAREVEAAQGILHRAPAWNVGRIAAKEPARRRTRKD
ncbi:GntR family transcriptional regulator [Luteimonas aestuarii]|nr:GntR family transcriptional regulator [Luteimonas aestuarii]